MVNEYFSLLQYNQNYFIALFLAIVTLHAYNITNIDVIDMFKTINMKIPKTFIDKLQCIIIIIFANTVKLISTIITVCGVMSTYAIYAEISKHTFFIYCIFNFIPTFAMYLHNIISHIEVLFIVIKNDKMEGVDL